MEHVRRILATEQQSQEHFLQEEVRRPSHDRHWSVLDPEHGIFTTERNRTQEYVTRTVFQGACQFGQYF